MFIILLLFVYLNINKIEYKILKIIKNNIHIKAVLILILIILYILFLN